MEYFHANLDSFIMRLLGEHFIARKWETKNPQNTPSSQKEMCFGGFCFPFPSSQNHHRRISDNLILLSTNKDEQNNRVS